MSGPADRRAGEERSEVSTLVLRRSSAVAAWWSLLGAALLTAGAFFVLDSNGHPIAWTVTAAFAVPSLYFLVQLGWPGAVEVRLDQDRLRARSPTARRTITWDDVHLAKVRRVLGDPVLDLEVQGDEGDLERVRVLLPVGADLDGLHGFLRERLGRGSRLPPPGSGRPPDL